MNLLTADTERMYMRKKKIVISVLSLAVIAAVVAICAANPQTGRCLVTTEGIYMIVNEKGSPIVMDNQSGNESLFDGLNSGDKIIITCPGMIQASYPGRTGVTICMRIAKGSLDDVPEETLSELRDMGWQFVSEP